VEKEDVAEKDKEMAGTGTTRGEVSMQKKQRNGAKPKGIQERMIPKKVPKVGRSLS